MIRQAEIEALKEILSENKDGEIKIARSFLEDIVDYFENQPKIGEWIPCSERLPEEHDSIFAKFKGTDRWNDSMFEKCSDVVNVTVANNKGHSVTTHAHTKDGQWNCDLLRWNKKYRIIAWQPLPEPYQPKGE